jgi:hypothetical protein
MSNSNTPFSIPPLNLAELPQPNIITFSLSREPQILQPVMGLINKPETMIPLLPGESMHIGYVPISEEEAFERTAVDNPFQEFALSISHFRIPRGKLSVEKLAELIHRFNSINYTVNVVVPKREWINGAPRHAIYETKVIHTWNRHCATIVVRVLALKDPYELAICVDRMCGSVTAHRMFLHTLEQYITSEGQSYPLIRQVSVSRKALLESKEPDPDNNYWSKIWKYKRDTDPCRNRTLQPSSCLDNPEDLYNAEKSDVEDDDEDDPCTPEGGNTLPDGSKVPTTSWTDAF